MSPKVGKNPCKFNPQALSSNMEVRDLSLGRTIESSKQDGLAFISRESRDSFGITIPCGFKTSNQNPILYVGAVGGSVGAAVFQALDSKVAEPDYKIDLVKFFHLEMGDEVHINFKTPLLMATKNEDAPIQLMNMSAISNDFSLFIQLGGSAKHVVVWNSPSDVEITGDEVEAKASEEKPRPRDRCFDCGTKFPTNCCIFSSCRCTPICESCLFDRKAAHEKQIYRCNLKFNKWMETVKVSKK